MNLLLSTFIMMGLTFLIGFFVAAIIKFIASGADYFDFYSSHRAELLRLRRWQHLRQRVEKLVRQSPLDEALLGADSREDFSRGINREIPSYRQGYYHGVSHGASQSNLMDYYYPEDTRIVFLEEEEVQHQIKKNSRQKQTFKQQQ